MWKATNRLPFSTRSLFRQQTLRRQYPSLLWRRCASQRESKATTAFEADALTQIPSQRRQLAHFTSPISPIRSSNPSSEQRLRLLTTQTSRQGQAGASQNEGMPGASRAEGPDMLAGVKSDLHVVRETFALRDVPREVLFFGLAGLAPYVITSSTTLLLAYDINNIQTVGRGFVFTQETASTLLDVLEPVQVGFGAVILSFLGAIHWGLEFAGFGGHAAYRRYSLGILAPALAWPTVFMPFDYALLTQFLGFTGMYFADAQATTKGWAPRWYTTYRFVLTFIVGASIVVTLVGRGKIGDRVVSYMPSPERRVSDLKSSQTTGYGKGTSPKEFQAAQKQGEAEAKAEKNNAKKSKEDEDMQEKEIAKTKKDENSKGNTPEDKEGTSEAGIGSDNSRGNADDSDKSTDSTKANDRTN